jgi:hypothetical protein
MDTESFESAQPRRSFLKTTAAAALTLNVLQKHADAAEVSPAAAEPSTSGVPKLLCQNADGLMVYQHGPQIWVRWKYRLVTCYRAHPSQKHPYLYPLMGPASRLSLTDEAALPWPNHLSLFFGCDRVNGGNYWEGDMNHGQIVSNGPTVGKIEKYAVEILDACDWGKPGGPVTMKDRRKISIVIPNERTRFLDFEILWQAVENITIQKTNHALFAMRAALDIAPNGGGKLVNSAGDSGEKATFGKKAAWCDFHGRRPTPTGDTIEGIAMFDHPKNPWSPCPWFTRDYGFASPMPTYFMEKPWKLPAGESVILRYRVVLHAGDPQEAGLDANYRTWAEKTS